MLDRNLRGSAGAINGEKIKLENDSWGYVLQAGVDVNLKDGWLVNADVKYVNIETDVKLDSAITGRWTKIDSLDINPWVFGLGIGKKF
jgi:outer membrane protein